MVVDHHKAHHGCMAPQGPWRWDPFVEMLPNQQVDETTIADEVLAAATAAPDHKTPAAHS